MLKDDGRLEFTGVLGVTSERRFCTRWAVPRNAALFTLKSINAEITNMNQTRRGIFQKKTYTAQEQRYWEEST